MEKETIRKIFDFIEKNDNKRKPLSFKIKNNEYIDKNDLIVKGDLFLKGVEITSLPEGLEVGGNLDLSSSLINSLPEGFKVGGTLWLLRCENLTSLPKGLRVGLHLDLWNSPLKKYTDDEIREMIKPGFINGKIFR